MRFFKSTADFYYTEDDCSLKIVDEEEVKMDFSKRKNAISLCINESGGFFVLLDIEKGSYLNIEKSNDIPWFGLKNTYRIQSISELSEINTSIVGFVKDDDGKFVADIIENKKGDYIIANKALLFIEITPKVSKVNFNTLKEKFIRDVEEKSIIEKVTFKLYKSDGYSDEVEVDSSDISIEILNYDYNDIEKSFFLDLWQHPCSWARKYDLEYFTDEHFNVIEKYLKNMANLGQKVIDLVVSDFPWAGQKCYEVEENRSRLYEYNIVGVKRVEGNLILDFSKMDRYIDMCIDLGIDEEINLFGMIGLWDRVDFGSPVVDYNDPIRVRVYDEDRNIYTYLKHREEIGEYFKKIIDHLEGRNLLKITKIIGDEPSSVEVFTEYANFLNRACGRNLEYKYALHSSDFFDNYDGSLDSFSVNTLQLADFCDGENYVDKLEKNSNNMTWYACWFPNSFNTFIRSPLIESRYIGLFTYVWRLKGMLRWAYALFTESDDIRYKGDRWPAGDMYLAYGDKNIGVRHSLREINIKFSIQDYNIFRHIENRISGKSGFFEENLYKTLRKKLNIDFMIKRDKEDICISKYPDIFYYDEVKSCILKKFLEEI